jgi:bacterioferritin-associated ferredoxin
VIVCLCHRISDRDIAGAAHAGCDSFELLQDELRVATACGACEDCARETLAAHAPGRGRCAAACHSVCFVAKAGESAASSVAA